MKFSMNILIKSMSSRDTKISETEKFLEKYKLLELT